MTRAAEQGRPDVAERRQRWRAGQPALDIEKLVFIDETWASTNMARRYGRAPRGERLVDHVPHGHWKTTTFVAGLRAGGLAEEVADAVLFLVSDAARFVNGAILDINGGRFLR